MADIAAIAGDELIDPATLSTDEKAVLWLLAWSLQSPSRQRAEVEAHMQQRSRARAAWTRHAAFRHPHASPRRDTAARSDGGRR
jgi:hypothetical protein